MRVVLASVALLVGMPAFAQPPRDIRRPVSGGTARIAGTVRSADPQARPLRRARVMLNGDALPIGRTVIADDSGTFVFDGLPSGRYTLAAAKEGYVNAAYGARRPERPGRSIPVRSGETRTVALRLQRGAVITGMVLDAAGDPAPGVTVAALTWRYMAATGERRPVTAGSGGTDDRGIYRIFGLAAGEYIVQAVPRLPVNDVQVLSDADVKRALAAVRENVALRSRPGIAPAAPPMISPPEPRKSVTLAPVFYPGTAAAERASSIEIGPAEERTAIDFQLDYVPTATVSGMVSEAATIALMPTAQSSVPINNVRATRAGADGRFSFSSVVPGAYTILARVYPLGTLPMSAGPPALAKAAQVDILVNGDDIAGISLALQPGLTAAGRFVFEGTTPTPLEMPGMRLATPAYMPLGPTTVPFPPLQLDGDGRFSVRGIVPGAYRIAGNAPGIRTPLGAWWLKSIMVGRRDLLDSPIELREDREDVIVTFSDRASELGGRVTDGRGAPRADGFVVVFSADRTTWFFNSRRIAGARPNSEGRYVVRNLPPGDYLVAVYDDLLANEWFDPAVLEQLAPGAAHVTIGGSERKTHDIVVR